MTQTQISKPPAEPPSEPIPGVPPVRPPSRRQVKRCYQKLEEMTLTDEWRTNYDNPKTCALCGKNLESGKFFYVSVRSELKETLICKDCLKDRKDDRTEKKYGRAC
jgi:hypothetical protein